MSEERSCCPIEPLEDAALREILRRFDEGDAAAFDEGLRLRREREEAHGARCATDGGIRRIDPRSVQSTGEEA